MHRMGCEGSRPSRIHASHGLRRVQTLPDPCITWVAKGPDPPLPMHRMGAEGSRPSLAYASHGCRRVQTKHRALPARSSRSLPRAAAAEAATPGQALRRDSISARARATPVWSGSPAHSVRPPSGSWRRPPARATWFTSCKAQDRALWEAACPRARRCPPPTKTPSVAGSLLGPRTTKEADKASEAPPANRQGAALSG